MKRIMVVEDDRRTAQAVAARLAAQGHSALVAHTLREALSMARRQQFDLFVLDVGLPDGDGLSLATELIHLPGHQATPIVFLTGRGDLSSRLRASQLGVCAWVDKPYQGEVLQDVVAKALQPAPVAAAYSPLASLRTPAAPPPKLSILVIEDDKRLAMALRCRLEHSGYEVLTAHTGRAGLEWALERKPTLIVSDIYMAGGLGLTLVEHLAAHGLPHVPVIFLTASRRPGLRETALRMGAAAFFEKPCDLTELLRSIRKTLYQHN